MKPLKIGPRIIKTGVSVALAIFVSNLIIPGNDGVLAGIAALNSTLPSLKKSYENLSNRMLGTAIGAIIAVLFVLLFQYSPLPDAILIGVTTITTITVLNLFHLNDVASLAVVAVIAIMLNESDHFIMNAFYRVLDTFIGVLLSFIINWFVFPPKYDVHFITIMEYITSETLRLIRATLRRNADFSLTHRDLKWSKQQLNKMDNYFTLIHNEMVIGNVKRTKLTRKLVIFRQLKKTTTHAVQLLDVLHHSNHLLNHLPDDMRIMIRERMETLLVAHEQIILKLVGKVHPERVNFMEITAEYRDNYLTTFHKQIWEWRHDYNDCMCKSNDLIKLMSIIYQYEEELKTLNRLMRSYKTYHQQGYMNEFDHSFIENLSL